MTIPALYQLYQHYPSVQTDTRRLQPGDIFFALKGPNFNGNTFAAKALEAGAPYAIIDDPAYQINDQCIVFENVLQTLQNLAHYHRKQFNIPFIAITGSNGKTTTKELIRAVLSTSFTTYATEGNLNNHIGIPLTILKIKPDTQMAVIEMGANHQGEIRSYCNIIDPTHGLITNVGKAHLEGFGGEEGVRKGKGELYDHLRKNNGTALVCSDLPFLKDMANGIAHLVTYGQEDAMIKGHLVSTEPFLQISFENIIINTQLTGVYNFYNVMAAIATGKYFGVSNADIKNSVEAYIPSNNRSQLIESGNNTIILDAYNANPSSMKAAVDNLISRKDFQKKAVLLGGMKELGKQTREEHEQLVTLLQSYPWEAVALVGEEFKDIPHEYHYFKDVLSAANWFKKQHFDHTLILIKGSRSMTMEKILE